MLDRLNRAIKVYLTSVDPDALDDDDNRRLGEILAFITNLEHAGDIIEKSLMSIAAKRLKRGRAFSTEGQAEIRNMLERLAANVQTAAAVFMTADACAARSLLGEKEVFRDLKAHATEAHFARIRAGRLESVETSALHSTCGWAEAATGRSGSRISRPRTTLRLTPGVGVVAPE